MSNAPEDLEPTRAKSLLQNWLSQLGLLVAICGFIAGLGLLAVDLFRGFSNPYMGILTHGIVPAALLVGLLLIGIGMLRERRRRLSTNLAPPFPRIDLNDARQRRAFVGVILATFLFLIASAIGLYRAYHFSESVAFCGVLCHSVMKPEYTLYQRSPHARVTCTQCHVGPGASWFVKSKISGLYQVYSTITKKYPRPIATPIENLRPARETCEQCHWPQKFTGSVERVRHIFQADEKNSSWTIRMLFKVGGGDPAIGPVTGIHWHMGASHKVEYLAKDHARQEIPWVKVTDEEGGVAIYEARGSKGKPEEVTSGDLRLMDCVDCHNRPSHIYTPPAKTVDEGLLVGRIDRALPFIKKNAVEAVINQGKSETEGLASIAHRLQRDYGGYPDQRKVQAAVAEVQRIYRLNFFPEMRADWRGYPNNIGHSIWPGCARCHDGEHLSADGRKIPRECNACHLIIAQGPGTEPRNLNASGLEFQHPGGEIEEDLLCGNCHSGALVE